MATSLIFFALCIASSMAMPSRFVRGNIYKCADTTLITAVKTGMASIDVCAEDAVEELMAIEKDLLTVTFSAVEQLYGLVEEFHACGDNIDCSDKVIKEIAGAFTGYIQKATDITEEHLDMWEEKFPESGACARDTFNTFRREIEQAVKDFHDCIVAA